MDTSADVIVIGAGIAGLSAAAEIAASAEVVVVEREDHPGFHATGRSAAYFAPAYGNETVRGISAACEMFFRKPPTGFTDVALLRPREAVLICRDDQRAAIAALLSEVHQLIAMDAVEMGRHVPILAPDYVTEGKSVGTGAMGIDSHLQSGIEVG